MIPMVNPMLGLRSLGVNPFSPADLSPYAWFNAQLHTEGDLGAIATLVDRSGNGRDFTQATGANKPFLRVPDATINGLNSIQFGESTVGVAGPRWFDRANTFLSGLTAGHYFWLFRANANAGGGSGADGALHGEMENHSGDTHNPYTDELAYTGFISTTRRSPRPTYDPVQWNIWEEWSASGDWGIKVNGDLLTSSASNTVGLNSNGKRIGMGNSTSSTLGYFRGRMAQMLYFGSKLSDPNAELIRRYLAEAAGFPEKLIKGHAGKTYPSATHWRIRSRDTNGTNDAIGYRELKMFASTDGSGTNLAVLSGGNAAIASYEDASFPKSNAFDGNTATFWTSVGTAPPSGGHWLGVAFASPVAIGSFNVHSRGDFNETPQIYALEYSLDSGSTWKIMKAGGAIPGNTATVIPT